MRLNILLASIVGIAGHHKFGGSNNIHAFIISISMDHKSRHGLAVSSGQSHQAELRCLLGCVLIWKFSWEGFASKHT